MLMRKDAMEKGRNDQTMKRWITAIVVLAAQTAFAQKILDLEGCLKSAFQRNPALQVAELNWSQANEKIGEAKSLIGPSVDVSGLYTHLGKVTSFKIPVGNEVRTVKFGTSDKVLMDANLQVPLFTWGRISGIVAAAEAVRTLTDNQRKQEWLNVTDQVLRSYYAVLMNHEVIRVRSAGRDRAARQDQTAEKRFQTGNTSNMDRLRAQMQLTSAEDALAEARGNLKKSLLALGKTIGVDDTALSVSGSFSIEPFQGDEEDLVTRAFQGRKELGILSAQMEMQRNTIRVAQSGNKPNLYAFSGYSVQNGFNPMEPDKFVDNWNAGVQLSIPLFDGFNTKHKAEEARIDLRKMEIQDRDLRDLIRMQVRQALLSLKLAEDNMAAQARNIDLSKEALKTAEIQYANGVIASLDLIDIQQVLTQSELLYNQALFNRILTELDLCKAVGDYRWFESALQENP
jgi:outer membrane protein TolC